MRIGLFICVFVAGGGRAEIIDRVAVSVGRQVITESEILRDQRVTAFVDGKPVDTSATARRAAADRLVERALIQREISFSRYPLPGPAEAKPLMAQIKARFPDDAAWRAALGRYFITEADLQEHLLAGLKIMRFTDLRFRSGIQLAPDEVRDFYEKQAAEFRQRNGKPAPPFEEARAEVEKLLLDQRSVQALDRWLGEARTQTHILYREQVFK